MKLLLTLLMVLLLVLVALPIAMGGMGEMADCPMCTSPDPHVALGICAAILCLMGVIILFSTSRARVLEERAGGFLLAPAIYRPPRFA